MMLARLLAAICHPYAVLCLTKRQRSLDLFIRILIRIGIIDIIILAVIEVLLGVVIVIRFLRVRTRSRPIIFLVNGIGFILVDFLVFFSVLVVCLFFCAGFCFVCAFLFGLDQALDLGQAVYFCDAERPALLGRGGVGSCAV
jgi:hypothetical protein